MDSATAPTVILSSVDNVDSDGRTINAAPPPSVRRSSRKRSKSNQFPRDHEAIGTTALGPAGSVASDAFSADPDAAEPHRASSRCGSSLTGGSPNGVEKQFPVTTSSISLPTEDRRLSSGPSNSAALEDRRDRRLQPLHARLDFSSSSSSSTSSSSTATAHSDVLIPMEDDGEDRGEYDDNDNDDGEETASDSRWRPDDETQKDPYATSQAAHGATNGTSSHQPPASAELGPAALGISKKKRGRKPQDPETQKVKRKAQNRDAQRAFRQRKENYIRELETRVAALEKRSAEADSQIRHLLSANADLMAENKSLREGLANTPSVTKPHAISTSASVSPQQHHIQPSPHDSQMLLAQQPPLNPSQQQRLPHHHHRQSSGHQPQQATPSLAPALPAGVVSPAANRGMLGHSANLPMSSPFNHPVYFPPSGVAPEFGVGLSCDDLRNMSHYQPSISRSPPDMSSANFPIVSSNELPLVGQNQQGDGRSMMRQGLSFESNSENKQGVLMHRRFLSGQSAAPPFLSIPPVYAPSAELMVDGSSAPLMVDAAANSTLSQLSSAAATRPEASPHPSQHYYHHNQPRLEEPKQQVYLSDELLQHPQHHSMHHSLQQSQTHPQQQHYPHSQQQHQQDHPFMHQPQHPHPNSHSQSHLYQQHQQDDHSKGQPTPHPSHSTQDAWPSSASTAGGSVMTPLSLSNTPLPALPVPKQPPCIWPNDSVEDTPAIREMTQRAIQTLVSQVSWMHRTSPPNGYHPFIDYIPCLPMKELLIRLQEEAKAAGVPPSIDIEAFIADVLVCSRCIGEPNDPKSWRVPPEFWVRYPSMRIFGTQDYFNRGLDDPTTAKNWVRESLAKGAAATVCAGASGDGVASSLSPPSSSFSSAAVQLPSTPSGPASSTSSPNAAGGLPVASIPSAATGAVGQLYSAG